MLKTTNTILEFLSVVKERNNEPKKKRPKQKRRKMQKEQILIDYKGKITKLYTLSEIGKKQYKLKNLKKKIEITKVY